MITSTGNAYDVLSSPTCTTGLTTEPTSTTYGVQVTDGSCSLVYQGNIGYSSKANILPHQLTPYLAAGSSVPAVVPQFTWHSGLHLWWGGTAQQEYVNGVGGGRRYLSIITRSSPPTEAPVTSRQVLMGFLALQTMASLEAVFFSSRFSSMSSATTSNALASRRRSSTSSEVAARAVSPARRFLPASGQSSQSRPKLMRNVLSKVRRADQPTARADLQAASAGCRIQAVGVPESTRIPKGVATPRALKALAQMPYRKGDRDALNSGP